jgi:hypothetical protein
MILARFHDGAAMEDAAQRLTRAGVAGVESYSPAPPDGLGYSPLPFVMLGLGVAAAIGAFLMQAYATTIGYRFDIGGRPDLFWPAYLPFSIETGMLTAMLTGLVGFLIAARMPALYDPVDEGSDFATASRDGWFLALPSAARDAAHDILQGAAFVEELPG